MSSISGREVMVVGAGFSGLVAAWRLQKDGFEVTVVEKSDHPGGMIRTGRHALGTFETAANGLLSSELVEELFKDCDVELLRPKKSARRRYLFVEGRVTRFPLSLTEALQTAWMALRARRVKPQPLETLESWAARALGKPMASKIVGTAMLGVYGAEGSQLSANLLVGRFYDPRRRKNKKGLIRGTVAPRDGMGELLRALKVTLEKRGVKFRLQTDAALMDRDSGRPVVVATAAWDAADFLKSVPALKNDSRIPALEKIESVPLLSLTLFFREPPPKLGFGTLFSQTPPFGERDGVLGCLQNSEIFDARVFAEPPVHSETWILGGVTHGTDMIRRTDAELIERILAKRARLIDPRSQNLLIGSQITRWPRAIPLYGPLLEKIRPQLLENENGVVLFGNYLGELGLASILESTRDLSERVRHA